MPRQQQPETADRFRIIAEVEAESLGPLLAQLAKMGLQNIGYELVTDVINFRKKLQGGGEELAKEWIAQRQSFKFSELATHFMENGRSKASAAKICVNLANEGALTALGNGYYSNVKAIAAPVATEEKSQHGNAGHPMPRFEKRGVDAIWQHIKNRKKRPFTLLELRQLFRAQGRNDASASPIITSMLKEKLIKRVGDGEYVAVDGAEPKAGRRKPGIEKNTQKRHAVSNRDLILAHVKGRKSFTSIEINKLFKDNGRPVNSATGQLSAMVKKGIFEKGGTGEYIVAKNSNTNGTGTETAHG